MTPNKNNFFMAFLASMTLGLAPFTPEPHIWGKLKWIAGGAVGMKPIDWWDILMHGAPFIWLLVLVFLFLLKKFTVKHSTE